MASLWSTLIGTTQTNTATNERKNAQISEKVKIQRISLESNLCKYFFYFHICSITCKKKFQSRLQDFGTGKWHRARSASLR